MHLLETFQPCVAILTQKLYKSLRGYMGILDTKDGPQNFMDPVYFLNVKGHFEINQNEKVIPD